MLNLEKVERDYVRWYPTALNAFSEQDVSRSLEAAPHRKAKGLYVHIPFCEKKCSFCNYNVLIKDNKEQSVRQSVHAYLEAIRQHALRCLALGWFDGVSIDSLYLGGGTPSFLDPQELYDLIGFFKSNFDFLEGAEISVEGNPISLDAEKACAIREAGATRLSIGVQSFEPRLLEILGRGVTRDENIDAVKLAKAAGIPIINVDIIYRNPSQTTEELLETIQTAAELGVNQVSMYPLWVRPKTKFLHDLTRRKLTLPSESDEFEQLVRAQAEFSQLHYEQYNVFDFVDDRANVCINTYHQWGDGEWLGIGPGATSFFGGSFFIHTYDTANYVSQVERGDGTVDLGITLTTRERMERTMIFGLRMFPFRKQRFRDQYGVEVEAIFGAQLAYLKEQGLLLDEGDTLRLASRGIFHVNGISKLFYSPHRKDTLQPLGRSKDGHQILERDL